MDRTFKWQMLITSFIPLWVSIITILLWDVFSKSYCSVAKLLKSNVVELTLALIILVATLVSAVCLSRFFKAKGKHGEQSGSAKIVNAKKSSTLVSDFLLAYVLPMIAFDFTNLLGIILFLIYFSVLAFLSIRNNNIYTNVYLEFMGYRVFECDIVCSAMGKQVNRSGCLIFSKSNLISCIGTEIAYFDFDNDKYIDLTHMPSRRKKHE